MITFSIIYVLILVFVIIPVFSIIIDKNLAEIKGQEIRDSVDVSNIAVYNSLDINSSSMANVDINATEALNIFRKILIKNLKLNPDLTPTSQSVAAEKVTIDEFTFYGSVPTVCSKGGTITRPAIHTCLTVPIKPSLYTKIIMNLLGKQYIELKIHVDSNLPVNK